MSAMYQMNFYSDSEYFRWGVPVVIFKRVVDSNTEFYILLLLYMMNRMINTMVTEIVYTWIINCVQDPKSQNTYYSYRVSLLIVLLNAMHISINRMFTVNGINSQVSFLLVDLIGNAIVIGYTNKKFIDRVYSERLLSSS